MYVRPSAFAIVVREALEGILEALIFHSNITSRFYDNSNNKRHPTPLMLSSLLHYT